MKRLTERDAFGNADIIGVDSEELQINLDLAELNRVTEALNKLADYEDLEEQGNLYEQDLAVSYPKDGEIILCRGIAEKLGIRNGDIVTLTDDSFHQTTVRVTGIFDNYTGRKQDGECIE